MDTRLTRRQGVALGTVAIGLGAGHAPSVARRIRRHRTGDGSVAGVIQHVALETQPADGPAATVFWETLGFTLIEPPPTLRDRAAWLERNGTQIHLLWTDEPTAQRAGHVAVVVPDYAATLERLRAAGHQVESRTEHWGAARAFARAPGGHRVELMAARPARTS
jgi:catechol 2,3-dioxygenase-like lactoylglutathione lyase family enzyme